MPCRSQRKQLFWARRRMTAIGGFRQAWRSKNSGDSKTPTRDWAQNRPENRVNTVCCRTGLCTPETEIGKSPPETGARNPPRKSRNARNCQPETGAPQPNLRECRRFSPTGKITPQRPDSLADDAVSGEPVCGANSLLTGKITGNFTKIGLLRENLPVRTQQNQLVRG